MRQFFTTIAMLAATALATYIAYTAFGVQKAIITAAAGTALTAVGSKIGKVLDHRAAMRKYEEERRQMRIDRYREQFEALAQDFGCELEVALEQCGLDHITTPEDIERIAIECAKAIRKAPKE